MEGRDSVEVSVVDNQLERALKGLKKMLRKEGILTQLKEKRFYEKPSVKKRRKRAKAAKRRRRIEIRATQRTR
ncbi:MAG: 30S ribosomal protein S21 [Desulfatibacillaceae bacterium]|nr:30S ribosomal protein S21 [Desulfatibacillaceae bacterium]